MGDLNQIVVVPVSKNERNKKIALTRVFVLIFDFHSLALSADE